MLRALEYFLILWTDFARRSGWIVVVSFLAAAALSGWYAVQNLRVNTDTSAMLDPDLPFQVRARDLRNAFPQIKDDVIVVIRAPTLDEADAFAGRLANELRADTKNFSAVFSPSHEEFFRDNGLLFLETSALEARLAQLSRASSLIERLVQSPTLGELFTTLAENDALAENADLGADTLQDIYAELASVAEASLLKETRPFSWLGALDPSAKDGPYMRLVYATPMLDYERLQPAKPALTALYDNVALLSVDFGGRVEAVVTGDPALRAEELASVRDGIGLSFLLSLIMVTVLLLIAFRSIALALITLLSLIISLVFTSAFATLAIGALNLVSVAFTVLLVGLGLDFAIHLLLHVQERRANGQSMRRSVRGAAHEVGPAMALAAPTTALAFLSFYPTDFDGIAQLGVIAGVGVLIAFAVSVTFLPAILNAAPLGKPRAASGSVRSGFQAIEKASKPITIITVLIGLGALLLTPQARFDADPMALRDPKSPSVRGFQYLFEDEQNTPYRLSRLVADQAEAEETAATARALSTVRSARSLSDLVPADQDEKLELIDIAAGTVAFALDSEPSPSNAEQTARAGAQALQSRLLEAYVDGPGAALATLLTAALEAEDDTALSEMEDNVFAFWPSLIETLRAQFNADYIALGDLPEAVSTRYVAADGRWRVDILPTEDLRDRAALDRFVKEVEAAFPDIGGGALQTKKAGAVISGAMVQATAIALIVIAVFLFFLVRRVSLVFLMLAPLALAAALTTAAGVLFDVPFNYANVIVLPLLIGIGVDSGIHLVMRQVRVRSGESVYGTSTPRAVLFSALTTVASFGSLMLSPHRGTASMGQLLSIAIAFTLLCTLVVLPAAFGLAGGVAKPPKRS
ncbi:MAG: MMPL family transporter [Pseudomonadota bacterium]